MCQQWYNAKFLDSTLTQFTSQFTVLSLKIEEEKKWFVSLVWIPDISLNFKKIDKSFAKRKRGKNKLKFYRFECGPTFECGN